MSILSEPRLIGVCKGVSVNDVDISPDESAVAAVGGDSSVSFWFTDGSHSFGQEPAVQLAERVSWINLVSGEMIYLGLISGVDYEVQKWNWLTQQQLKIFKTEDLCEDGGLQAMAVAPDESYLVAVGGSAPAQVFAWDTESGEILWRVRTYKWAYGLGISPDSELIAVTCWDGRIYLWNRDGPGEGTGPHELDPSWGEGLPYRPSCFFRALFSPDGKLLVAAGEDIKNTKDERRPSHIQLFDVLRRVHVSEMPGNDGGTHAVGFSPDGRWLASGGQDGHLRLREVATGEELAAVDLNELNLPRHPRDYQRYGGGASIFSERFNVSGFSDSTIHALKVAPSGGFIVVGTESGAVLRVNVSS